MDVIQTRNQNLMQRAAAANVAQLDAIVQAKKEGATEADLAAALAFQRKAQWRLDFVAAENSMGFHAPQEAARLLESRPTTRVRDRLHPLIRWRRAQPVPQSDAGSRP